MDSIDPTAEKDLMRQVAGQFADASEQEVRLVPVEGSQSSLQSLLEGRQFPGIQDKSAKESLQEKCIAKSLHCEYVSKISRCGN